jgi:glycine cleavage system H protein
VEIEGCSLPEDRLYDWENRTWAAPEGSGPIWKVGLIAPFLGFIGPVSAVTFRPDGSLDRDRSLGMVETVRFTGAVRIPFDGEVVELNANLRSRPRLLNDEPYGAGWFARVRPKRPEEDRPWLETAATIRSRASEWIQAQHVRCWPVTPDLEMFEIGLECSAILTQVNEELARRPAGWAIRLVTDDPTSPIEMERWSDQTGHALLARRRQGNLYEFLLRKEEHPVPRVPRRG